jgi:isocitrate/isopropylmalate dehydrogenase
VTTSYRVAIIPGDGIGPELVDAATAVLHRVQDRVGGFRLKLETVDGGADTYRRLGRPLGVNHVDELRAYDAILKGPVGLPEVRTPDGIEAGLLGGVLRIGLDLYANVRPIRLLPNVNYPLRADLSAIDYVFVRENTEGLYASRGRGVRNEHAATDLLFVTRAGCMRVARYGFELARQRSGAPDDGAHRVTCVDKSNVLGSYAFFRDVVTEVAADYRDIELEFVYADAMTQAMIMRPGHFDVIVTENFLGDILTDLGAATVGGLGFCPSGNMGDSCAYFEPCHGSAPDIAGQNVANPVSQILSAAMMLNHLGERAAAARIFGAVDAVAETGLLVTDRYGRVEGGSNRLVEQITEFV